MSLQMCAACNTRECKYTESNNKRNHSVRSVAYAIESLISTTDQDRARIQERNSEAPGQDDAWTGA
jgi:hypothetical protein